MKRLFILASLFASLSAFAVSGSVTVSIAAAGMTNVLAPLRGSAQITQVILTAPANNTASVTMVDSVTNILTYTNASYITLGSYVTNYITTYTNFFGTVNSFTNAALVDYSITNAATAYSYPNLLTVTAGTNSSVMIPYPQTFNFRNGVYATNTGSGSLTLTVTYIK